MTTQKRYVRAAHLTAWARTSNIAAMSAAPSPADLDPGADGLVEMERELIRLLIEYDDLRTAWPKGAHVLVRARIGRQVADALARIADLLDDIMATRRQGHRRRLRCSLGGCRPCRGLGSSPETPPGAARRR